MKSLINFLKIITLIASIGSGPSVYAGKESDGPTVGRRGPIQAVPVRQSPQIPETPVDRESELNPVQEKSVAVDEVRANVSRPVFIGDRVAQSDGQQSKQNTKPWYSIIWDYWEGLKKKIELPKINSSSSRVASPQGQFSSTQTQQPAKENQILVLGESNSAPVENQICDYLGYILANQELTDRSVAIRAVQAALKLRSAKELVLFSSTTGGQNIVLDTRRGQWTFYGIETAHHGKIVVEMAKPSISSSGGLSEGKDLFQYRDRHGQSLLTVFIGLGEFKQKVLQAVHSPTESAEGSVVNRAGCKDPTWNMVRVLEN
jgi:hypothetical protein